MSPGVDDVRTGLQQFNSRHSVDESNWWLNFIITEEEERFGDNVLSTTDEEIQEHFVKRSSVSGSQE
jgi:hypothetical protein